MIVADTSGLLAFFNRAEPRHAAVTDVMLAAAGRIVVPPYVAAELDHLLATRVGARAALLVMRELSRGAYVLPSMAAGDLAAAADVIEAYPDLDVGVADASIVVLARRYRTREVLTLDRRHFGVLRPLDGGRFTLLP
jgi:uncharacterized protein